MTPEENDIASEATKEFEALYPQQYMAVVRLDPHHGTYLNTVGTVSEWTDKKYAIDLAISAMNGLKGSEEPDTFLILLRKIRLGTAQTKVSKIKISDTTIESVYFFKNGKWKRVWGIPFFSET